MGLKVATESRILEVTSSIHTLWINQVLTPWVSRRYVPGGGFLAKFFRICVLLACVALPIGLTSLGRPFRLKTAPLD